LISSPGGSRLQSQPIYLLLILVIIAIDYITKAYALSYIPLMSESLPSFPYGGIAVCKDFFGVEFSFSLTTNTGAAWGLFSDYPKILTLVRAVILGALLVGWFFVGDRRYFLPYSLILGGAFGNMMDLMLQGYVVDMIHFKFWGYDYPVFNIADCCICIGVFWWVILGWIKKP
jgi:signal peptidase II